MKREIKRIELEDIKSPRCAQYTISLKQLTEGYSVETSWGGARGKKMKEAYYRGSLQAALEKFDQLANAKTGSRHRGNRRYQAVVKSQPSLLLLAA